MADCAFTIRASVAAICCDDETGCADATLTVSLDSVDGSAVYGPDGNLVDCGVIDSFTVDPETCCVETCPLPANSDLSGTATYSVSLTTENGNTFSYDSLYFDAGTYPALCGGIVDFANLSDYQI